MILKILQYVDIHKFKLGKILNEEVTSENWFIFLDKSNLSSTELAKFAQNIVSWRLFFNQVKNLSPLIIWNMWSSPKKLNY